MKKLFFAFLITSAVHAQKVGIGMNLPLLLDNTIDLNVVTPLNKRIKVNFNVGGSANTRDIFSTKYSNYYVQQPNDEFYYSSLSKSASGAYGKLGLFFTFNLPDLLSSNNDPETSGFQFYLGPIIGFSRYNQKGTETKTPVVKYDATGKPINTTAISTTSSISEQGSLTGTGFGFGFTLAARKEISADLGVDILGYERTSKFNSSVQTLGMGAIPVLRINYNLGKK
jgi:hypothetical protein